MAESWLMSHWRLPFNGAVTPMSTLVQEMWAAHNSEDEDWMDKLLVSMSSQTHTNRVWDDQLPH